MLSFTLHTYLSDSDINFVLHDKCSLTYVHVHDLLIVNLLLLNQATNIYETSCDYVSL